MNIIIRGIHLELTPAIEEYTEKRLGSIKKFLDDASKIDVELKKISNHHKSGEIFAADINVTRRGQYSRASAHADTLYAAIDDAHGEIANILASEKDKKRTLWKRGHQVVKDMVRGVQSFGGKSFESVSRISRRVWKRNKADAQILDELSEE